MMTNPNGLTAMSVPDTSAMIDAALATVSACDLGTMPDLSDVEMATAIGQLTATLRMLLAAIDHRPTSTAAAAPAA